MFHHTYLLHTTYLLSETISLHIHVGQVYIPGWHSHSDTMIDLTADATPDGKYYKLQFRCSYRSPYNQANPSLNRTVNDRHGFIGSSSPVSFTLCG